MMLYTPDVFGPNEKEINHGRAVVANTLDGFRSKFL
jgi:hypothetical protein